MDSEHVSGLDIREKMAGHLSANEMAEWKNVHFPMLVLMMQSVSVCDHSHSHHPRDVLHRLRIHSDLYPMSLYPHSNRLQGRRTHDELIDLEKR